MIWMGLRYCSQNQTVAIRQWLNEVGLCEHGAVQPVVSEMSNKELWSPLLFILSYPFQNLRCSHYSRDDENPVLALGSSRKNESVQSLALEDVRN